MFPSLYFFLEIVQAIGNISRSCIHFVCQGSHGAIRPLLLFGPVTTLNIDTVESWSHLLKYKGGGIEFLYSLLSLECF